MMQDFLLYHIEAECYYFDKFKFSDRDNMEKVPYTLGACCPRLAAGFSSMLRMRLQPGICPFPVLGFWGKNTMPYAGRNVTGQNAAQRVSSYQSTQYWQVYGSTRGAIHAGGAILFYAF